MKFVSWFQTTFCVSLLLLSAAALLGNPRRRQEQSNSKGARQTVQSVFAANCAGCHGLDGKGGERAPDIVTRPHSRQLSDQQIFQLIKNGIPNSAMPAFARLGEPQLHRLVAHLRSLQGSGTTSTAVPGDARQGEELFFGKAGCSDCHMVQGQGGFFASDLTRYASERAPDSVREAILDPNRDPKPQARSVNIVLSDGTRLSGIARNEDNFSLQLLTPDGSIHLLPKESVKSLDHLSSSAMPGDYGTRLSGKEIDDLISFLFLSAKSSAPSVPVKQTGDDE